MVSNAFHFRTKGFFQGETLKADIVFVAFLNEEVLKNIIIRNY